MLPELVFTTNQVQNNSEVDVDGKRHINRVKNNGLPQVHNLSCSSNEVQSLSTAFKKWQTSAPKLHQYRPDEIEVVIHRRTGKVDRVKRSKRNAKRSKSPINESSQSNDEINQENIPNSDAQVLGSSFEKNINESELRRTPTPTMLSDDQVTTEDKQESVISSLEDQSSDSYNEDVEEEESDCEKCRALKERLQEAIYEVNARQNIIEALTSLNNSQVEVCRKLENQIKELNQRLINTELVYSQNMLTIRDSLHTYTKKTQTVPNRSTQYNSNELRLMQLIEKSRAAFSVERGDPDGMDSVIVNDTSLERIQRAITNISNHLDSSKKSPD